MALDSQRMKAKMSERIFQGIKRVFNEVDSVDGYSDIVEEQWRKMADAISDIAIDIVAEIQDNAQVNPGIAVSTTSGSGNTVAPGKIT